VVQALTVTDRGIAAGGRFDFAGNAGDWLRCNSVALWDGERWESLGLEDWRFAETDGLAIHQGVLYAIGSFADPSGRYGSVMQDTGAGWQLVGSGDDQPFLNANHGVSALGELFVGGSANRWDAFGGLARWDGSTWRDVGRGITRGNYVSALVEHGGELVVSGDFEEVGGVPCLNVAAWSPASGWHALGEGLRGYASALLSHDGVLYAAGMFRLSTSPGSATVGIARWRDGRWDALRAGSADQLGWYQGRLVASSYGWIATLEADSTWRPLGSGTNGRVLSMVESAGTLYVGGFLSRAGPNPAYGFAAWREGAGGSEPQTLIAPAMSPRPNPFASAVHLRYELSVASHAKVEMFDLAGHRVDLVFDGPQAAGVQNVAWNPSAARVKAGVYYARLTIGVSTSVVQVVRIP